MRNFTIASLLAASIAGGAIAGVTLDDVIRDRLTPVNERIEQSQAQHAHVTRRVTLSQGKRETIEDFYISNGRNMPLEVEYRGIDTLTRLGGLYFNGQHMQLVWGEGTIVPINPFIGPHGIYIRANKISNQVLELDVMNYNEQEMLDK